MRTSPSIEASPDSGILFAYPRYVLKGGEVVVEEGEIRAVSERASSSSSGRSSTRRSKTYIRPLFQKVYTMSFENYPVEMERIKGADVRSL